MSNKQIIFKCNRKHCSYTSNNRGRYKCHLKSHQNHKIIFKHVHVSCVMERCNWKGFDSKLREHLNSKHKSET